MSLLKFNHEGWKVVTNSWSAAADDRDETKIAYTWGADGISIFSGATSVRILVLKMDFEDFMSKVASSRGILDLTRYQGHD